MRQVALLQQEAAAAMQSAILRDAFPYKEGEKLPDEWGWEELINIFKVDKKQIGPADPIYSEMPFIGLENIEAHTRKHIQGDEKNEAGSACFLFDNTHVLYGKLRPYLNKVYLPQNKGKCSMELLPLKPQDGFSREFVAAVLQTEGVFNCAVQYSTGGRMPRADMNKLMKLQVPILFRNPTTETSKLKILKVG